MRTEEWIHVLASGVEPPSASSMSRRRAAALGLGVALAIGMLLAIYGTGSQLIRDAGQGLFWARFAFLALLFAVAWFACLRLSRPGASLGPVPAALAVPIMGLWIAATWTWVTAAPDARETLLFGSSWRACPFNIAGLSIPVFIAAIWSFKQYAPTRLRAAGAAAGLMAGASGALVYTLHCPELALPFVGVWYVLGILIPTIAGAMLGPRLLRW